MKIITKRKENPVTLLISGLRGSGKTTFAGDIDNNIFIHTEDNDEYDFARFETVKSSRDILDQLCWLAEKKNHTYTTVTIDCLDGIETIMSNEILAKEPGKTMATACGGYGKAFEQLAKGMHDFLSFLIPLSRFMNVVLISHAEKTKHEDLLTGTTYDCYSPSLHKKVRPIFENWVSVILFAGYEVRKYDNAPSMSRRVIYTEETPYLVAKNRFELPKKMDFSRGIWYEIKKRIDNYYQPSELDILRKEFSSLPEDVKIANSEKMKQCNGDVNKIKEIMNEIRIK
jgi:hypothetical protein